MKSLPVFLATCLLSISAMAQKKWDLRSIVDYAMTNNISVKLSDVQAQQAQLTYKQSKLSQIPNASFNGNYGLNSGSNQDPTSFGRITQTYMSAGLQLQTSADIFNFFSKRNTIAANEWELQAAKANTDKLKNDIALTVANAYLQILLSKEQENITSVQIQQTTAQLNNTKKLVDAGALPPLNFTQLEAQLALDSVNYITAKGAVVQNILTLKAYMSLDPASDFEVETPSIESIPLVPIADLLPENVYQLALKNQPQQKYNALKLKAAEKNMAAAKGAMYPTFSLFGTLGSGYNSKAEEATAIPVNPPIGKVEVGGVDYDVFSTQQLYAYSYNKSGFGNQLSDNFRQALGISISIPIFNGASLRTNFQRSKLNINTLQLQRTLDDLNLKQNIFQAYNAVLIAMEKFNASRKSVDASQLTYDYAKKRFDVGMLGTFDLITTQNNLLTAKLQYTINRFDYVFKMKVLEFYRGQGIKL